MRRTPRPHGAGPVLLAVGLTIASPCAAHPSPQSDPSGIRVLERAQVPVPARPRLHPLPVHASGPRSMRGLERRGPDRGPALPDTLRVLVLRVSFPTDSDPATTGDGSFDLRTLEEFRAQEGHDIDAAPHDRGYVERHMRALGNYWWANSRGAFSIRASVLPAAPTAAFLLPHPMAYYGFSSPLGSLEDAFEALVQDAVDAAEAASDPVDWTAWDAFVVFHAGADWQGDAGGAGDTPSDIPTAYISLGTPISVGGALIADATILPETVSQDGFVGALNGVFAHEFGHQLGLPDLYDTVGGRTAVGWFALMDSGDTVGGELDGRYVRGVLPAGLCAWSRWYLGWEDPLVLTGGSADLSAAGALAGVHPAVGGERAVRVPFGPGQSWWVEYRPDDLDGAPGVSLFWEDGVIDGTAALVGGVKTRTYEYDALLPGSGVLIWRLDEEVASADPDGDGLTNLEANTLQQDRLGRFLDLEEADGGQQIGWETGYLGRAEDYWNPAPDGPDRFGPGTVPATVSRTGAQTGRVLTIADVPASLTVGFGVAAEDPAGQWQTDVAGGTSAASVPWLLDRAPGDPWIVLLDAGGGLHRYLTDGTPVLPDPVWTAPSPPSFPLTRSGDHLVVAVSDTLWFVDPAVGTATPVSLPGVVVLRPAGGGAGDVLVALSGGAVVRVDAAGTLTGWTLPADAGTLMRPASGPPLAGTGDAVFALDPGGAARLLYESPSGILDAVAFTRETGRTDSLAFAVLGATSGIVFCTYGQSDAAGTALEYARVPAGLPTGGFGMAVLEAGTQPVLTVPTRDGVQAVSFNGVPAADWPTRSRGRAATAPPIPVGTPLSVRPGLVIALTDQGEAVTWDGRARIPAGGVFQFPVLADGGPTIGGLGPGSGHALVTAGSGVLAFRTFSGAAGSSVLWAGPGGGLEGTGWAAAPLPAATGSVFSEAADLYVYPNPVRGPSVRIRAEGLAGELVVRAYTAAGSSLGEVARLQNLTAGPAESAWDVSRLAPGVYWLVGDLQEGGRTVRRLRTKMLVVR